MTDALEDHKGIVIVGGRTITNLCFADDINVSAGEEEELAKLVECLDKASTVYVRHGDWCREDQADGKQHHLHQHRDQSEWTEA